MINRDMKPIMLQKKEEIKTPSGATKEKWVDVGSIDVAIYKTNDYRNTQSVRYNESTHTGLTRCKDIKEGVNRLVNGEVVYDLTSANSKGRLTTLLLKVVDTNAR
ncbi:hypothetical protein [Clostridium sp.]|uniref:hypothetical protein n=1 Tax=Clostridium sp. TaxID=1506 RepID=UPI003216DB14